MLEWLRDIFWPKPRKAALVWLPKGTPSPEVHGISPPGSQEDIQAPLQWLDPSTTPFSTPVLDCRSITRGVVSTAQDQATLDRYAALRNDAGEHLGRAGADELHTTVCDLAYPLEPGVTALPEGRRYSSRRLEYKWDIAHWDGHLLFSRSWTGALVYRCRAEVVGSTLRIHTIETPVLDDIRPASDAFVRAAVDFLVRALLMGQVTPHPMPEIFGDDLRAYAVWSFREFGCDARFGFLVPP